MTDTGSQISPGPGGSRVRLAFLSDLHANLPALEAALAVVQRLAPEEILAAGDLVGGGPHPAQVIDLLRRRQIPSVRGNVDRKVAALGQRRSRLEGELAHRKRANYAWTALQLEPKDLFWLAGLPVQHAFVVAGAEVVVVHGSPLGDADYVFPSLTARALREKLQGRRPEVLVCGHSHVPFVRRLDGVLVVNCGSVGRPVDGDPRGSLAVVGLGGGRPPQGRIVRFSYAVEDLARDLERLAVPGTVADEYRRGVKHAGA